MSTRSATEPPRARAVADARVDEASAASMDASDPPAYGGITGVGAPDARDRESRRRAARAVRRSRT